MVNESSRKILKLVADKGEQGATIEELKSLDVFHPLRLGALMQSSVAYVVKKNNRFYITEKGLAVLGFQSQPVTVTEERRLESVLSDLVKIVVERDKYTFVKIQINPSFRKWLLDNGEVVEITSDYLANNFDAQIGKHKILDIVLPSQLPSDTDSIITTTREGKYILSSVLLKLAVANGGTWKVRYKRLVGKEVIVQAVNEFKARLKQFYIEYVKPVRIEVTLKVVEW